MADDSDLFVECRSCGAEVSRFVTECPYCGARLQRRAPRLPPEAPAARRPRRTPGRGLAEEDPTRRPVVALVLAGLCAAGTVILVPGALAASQAGVVGSLDGEWWRVASSPFLASNVWYGAIGTLAVAVFGTLVERRNGPLAVLAIFVICGIGSIAVAAGLEMVPFALGANGAALGLIGAWAVPEAREVGTGRREWTELLPAGACAAVMLLMPLAAPEASPTAGVFGLAAGLLIGAILSRR